jgi:hypothetical protein
MPAFIIPTAFGVGRSNDLLQQANDAVYLFVADHRPTTNTDLPDLTQATSNTYYEPWRQMIMGKRVTQMAPGIRRIPYTYNTPYDRYDDRQDLSSRDWYAIVNAGSYSHIYTCLDNAEGANSTVAPDFATAIAADDYSYRTSDGYRWMYIATTGSSQIANLATSDLFPVYANASVTAAAVPGGISVVAIDYEGKRYDNYLAGTLQASDIRVDATPTVYQLSNSTIHSVNGYYTGCVMVITSGTGVGQYATVSDFFCTEDGNFANLDIAFPITPTNGSEFEIYPGVLVTSDGTQTTNVVARALVNANASNAIHLVEVLNKGVGFQAQTSATVVANAVVGVTDPAIVYPILPPRGGHGADPICELGASVVLYGCALANGEANTIPATNDYRQIGLIRNPRFANVEFTLTGTTGLFTQDETISFMNPRTVAVNATCVASNLTITTPTGAFVNGSSIMVSDGVNNFLGIVNVVTNTTSLTVSTAPDFSANQQLTVYDPGIVDTGVMINPISGSNVFVTNVSPSVNTGMTLYGHASACRGTISSMHRNGVTKGFNTFVQLRKYAISVLGGTFQENETVFQGNTTGIVHSANSSHILISNQDGEFAVPGANFTGDSSGAIASPTTKYSSEVIFGSGPIEYIENLETITRTDGQTEGYIFPFQF